jgi:DNA-binding GntR family transcriptional regulator
MKRAAAPGRPKQGPTLPEGRSPYPASGVPSSPGAAAPGRPRQGPTLPEGRLAVPGHRGAVITDAEIHQRIVAAVMDHRLAPGTKLVEDKLGQAFGVSRTRVRQVLIRLANEQIVTLAPNRGASIAQPGVQESREVFEVRRLVEPTLLARFIEHASAGQRAALAANIAGEEAAHAAGDRHAAIRLSGEFHLLIAEGAGHHTLQRLMHELVSRTSLVLMTYGGPHGRGPLRRQGPLRVDTTCGCHDHRALLAAIEGGHAEAGARLMQQHLTALEGDLHFQVAGAPAADLVQLLSAPAAPSPAQRLRRRAAGKS